jgi:phage shock protein A
VGLRRRLSFLLRARARAAQRRLEDPLESLDLAYSRELATAEAIRQGVAGMVTAQTRLRIERESLERTRPRLEETARRELRRGREDLAAAALTQAELLGGQVEAVRAQEGRLGADREALEGAARHHQARLAVLRAQREALGARYTADRARLGASEALAGLGAGETAVRALLERARERMLEAQARADALTEMARRSPLGDETDAAAAATSAAVAASVGRRLAALRDDPARPPGPGGRLVEGAPRDDAPGPPAGG